MKKYRVLKDIPKYRLTAGEVIDKLDAYKPLDFNNSEYFKKIKEQSLAEKIYSNDFITNQGQKGTGILDINEAEVIVNKIINEVLKVFDEIDNLNESCDCYKCRKNNALIRKAIENMKSEQNV